MEVTCPDCGKSVPLDARATRDQLRAMQCPHCEALFDARAEMARAPAVAQVRRTRRASGELPRPPAPTPMPAAPGDAPAPTGPRGSGGNPTLGERRGPRASDSTMTAAPKRRSERVRRSDGDGRRTPGKIGPYEIRDEISRGGMGIVYRAVDPVLRRNVAIKVLLAGEGATDEDVKRFQREAQASARLQHSNIVPIHSIGEYEGKPYFVMDFVEGQTVKQLLEKGPMAPRLSMSITEQAAEALDHAARQGVIHRDVKPANIIVDEYGQSRIMDFGLAKRVDEDLTITQSGTTMGTPSYMSPEQAEGDLASVDANSDIYSLGAVLYEMLTGQPPFDGPTTMAVLRKVLDEDPEPPHKLNPRVHADIETICLKCLEKEKARRYQTGRELAEDIRRFNAGEPISAAPVGFFAHWMRKAKKNIHITFSALAILVVLVAVVVWQVYADARDARDRFLEKQGNIKKLLKNGKSKLGEAEAALKNLDLYDSDEAAGFNKQAGEAREILVEAEDAFRSVLLLAPENPDAQAGLADTDQVVEKLEIERFVFKARSFLKPPPRGPDQAPDPPNYAAAEAFAQEALAKAPKHEEAKAILKKAIGIREVTIHTQGGTAEVFARLIADARGNPVNDRGERMVLGTSLGWTPISNREMSPGRYVLSFKRPDHQLQEATLHVSRESDPEMTIELSAADENMVRIGPGEVAMPQVGLVKVKPFLIDRFEYPNRAGLRPTTNITTLLEARNVCASAGKKLCTSQQWLRACMGDQENKWPYGSSYRGGFCATGLDPGLQKNPYPSGWFARCRSPQGVYDMSGNVSEWTDGGENDEIIFGGDWTESVRTPDLTISCRARQLPVLVNKERAGVRCCKAAK